MEALKDWANYVFITEPINIEGLKFDEYTNDWKETVFGCTLWRVNEVFDGMADIYSAMPFNPRTEYVELRREINFMDFITRVIKVVE